MANYILEILKTNLMIVFSWGFRSPRAVKNGLSFMVSGFKYKGEVQVIYNEGKDLFEIHLPATSKIIQDVYFDQLIEVIDNEVEKIANYEQKIKSEYGNQNKSSHIR